MEFDVPAILRFLLRSLKADAYDTMNRIARGWAPGNPMSQPPLGPIDRSSRLSFSSRSRKRLTWIRQACGQGH